MLHIATALQQYACNAVHKYLNYQYLLIFVVLKSFSLTKEE